MRTLKDLIALYVSEDTDLDRLMKPYVARAMRDAAVTARKFTEEAYANPCLALHEDIGPPFPPGVKNDVDCAPCQWTRLLRRMDERWEAFLLDK